MANSSVPFGFMPYGRVDGGAPTWELEQVNINSSDTNLYFTGDLVARSSTPSNNVILLTTGLGGAVPPAGVFWGCEYYSAGAQRVVWSRYYPGSVGTNATVGVTKAWVISDPNTLFRCVGGSSGAGATWAAGDIGANTVIVTSQSSYGNTATGQSAMMASSATTTAASAPWKIIDLLANRSVSGTPGTDAAAYNQIIVKPNQWERAAGTIGVST